METEKTSIVSDINNLRLMIEGEESVALTTLPLRRQGFDEDKEFIRFVKNVEKIIRSSAEYRDWVHYVRDVLGYSSCAITDERAAELTIEIHHHPVSLYVLCKGIITDYINKQKEFCSYDIALDAITMHFQNRIGYIPLISSIHEKFHNGFLRIAIEKCAGDWRYILNNYPIDEVDLSIISEFAQVKLADLKQTWVVNNYPGVVNG